MGVDHVTGRKLIGPARRDERGPPALDLSAADGGGRALASTSLGGGGEGRRRRTKGKWGKRIRARYWREWSPGFRL